MIIRPINYNISFRALFYRFINCAYVQNNTVMANELAEPCSHRHNCKHAHESLSTPMWIADSWYIRMWYIYDLSHIIATCHQIWDNVAGLPKDCNNKQK